MREASAASFVRLCSPEQHGGTMPKFAHQLFFDRAAIGLIGVLHHFTPSLTKSVRDESTTRFTPHNLTVRNRPARVNR